MIYYFPIPFYSGFSHRATIGRPYCFVTTKTLCFEQGVIASVSVAIPYRNSRYATGLPRRTKALLAMTRYHLAYNAIVQVLKLTVLLVVC